MVSQNNLERTARRLLGEFVPADFPFAQLADELSRREEKLNIKLSAYGHVMWAYDHYGTKCAFKNILDSSHVIDGYVNAALKYKNDMPAMLVNASMYVTTIMSNISDLDTCFEKLEGMTFPYVMYILFAASGDRSLVERYRSQAEEQLRRYPSTLDLLPESYRKIGEELLGDADAE